MDLHWGTSHYRCSTAKEGICVPGTRINVVFISLVMIFLVQTRPILTDKPEETVNRRCYIEIGNTAQVNRKTEVVCSWINW